MKTTIQVDKEDLIRFEEYAKSVRNAGRNLGELRVSDGWSFKMKYLIDCRIDGDRKLQKRFFELSKDRNERVGESESLRLLNSKLKEQVEKLQEVQNGHSVEMRKLLDEKEEWKRKYLEI